LLRYFTASQAIEHCIPIEELRIRDPMSGKRFPSQPGFDGSPISFAKKLRTEAREKYGNVTPTKLDHKGHYGVAIVWSDGHFADIFPYDVLRNIAAEIELENEAEGN
jgi:hypothetical protein